MSDNAESTNTPSVAPDPNPAAGPEIIVGSANSPADGSAPTAAPPPKPRGYTWLFILLMAAAVVLLAVVVYILLQSSHRSAQTVKRDIPSLNYGLAGGPLTATYPLGGGPTSAALMTEVNAQLFEGLVGYQNQTKVVPLLATDWFTTNDTTWIFNLRQGVQFHSGRAMTAQDVKASLDYAVVHRGSATAAPALALAATIKEVDVANDYQVKIITNGPDPTLLNRLAGLYVFDTQATLGDPNAGTGPYIIKPGTKPSATTMDLAAFDNYWGGHVYTRSVHLVTMTDAAQLGAAASQGQFDLAGDLPDGQLAKLHDYRTINVQAPAVAYLGLNASRPGSPLQVLAARQAAAEAMNVSAILQAGGRHGQAASQLVPLLVAGHDPSIKTITYDPGQAKRLLATAGNAAVPLTLAYAAGDDKPATEIASELNAAGFNVKTLAEPDAATLANVARAGLADLFYASYNSPIPDGLDILNNTALGTAGYDNSKVDQLAQQAAMTLDQAARARLLQKIAVQLAKDVPDVPLYIPVRDYALTQPYNLRVDIPNAEAGVYFWQAYR